MRVGRLLIVAVLATAAVTATAGPAVADNTTTTFILAAGTLSVSVPASVSLGSTATGSATLTGSLGTVTVSDLRGPLLGTWTTTVSSTPFKTGGQTANETISNANISYASGTATATGVGVFTPGQATVGAAQALSVSRTAYSASVLVGNNSAAWNPTIVVTIPAAAVAGTYTGTITHSVA